MDQLNPRRRSALVGLLLLTAGLSACTSSPAPHLSPQPTVPATAPATTAPSTPQPSALTIPTLPPQEPGLTTLATVDLTDAGESLPDISGKVGDLQITILCTGGMLTLHLDPVTVTAIPCAIGSITPSRNVFRLSTPRRLGIRVEVAAGVRWNMRVEE